MRLATFWRVAVVVTIVGTIAFAVLGLLGLRANPLRILFLVPLPLAVWAGVPYLNIAFDADDAGVQIRGLRSTSFAWSEVLSVEPSHYGLVFHLRNGRRVVASATAKTGVIFLPPRYDPQLLAALRARIESSE